MFDWNRPVDYKVLSNGDDAVVTFDAAAQIDLDAFRAAMPQELRNVGVARENGQTLVTVPLPADGRVRHFTSGTKVVLDLLPPAGRQPPRRTPEEREAVPDDAVAAAPTPAALPAPKPAGETAGEDAPAPVQPPQALSGARPQAGEEGDRGTEATPATALVNALREARGEKAAADERRRQMAQAAEELEAAANTGEAVDAGEDEQAAPDVRARVASLSFSWNEPTAAAVFRRGGYLWVVFDRYQEVDTNLLRPSWRGCRALGGANSQPRVYHCPHGDRAGLQPQYSPRRSAVDRRSDAPAPEAGDGH